MDDSSNKCRIGVVGFGSLGKFLVDKILEHPESLTLCFIWNRTSSAIESDGRALPVLKELADCAACKPDLIVEVAHPSITVDFGALFLGVCDYFVGSPTAFADERLDGLLQSCTTRQCGHSLFVPSGALWGAHDIQKMADRGTIHGLRITMKKHPDAFKLCGYLREKLEQLVDEGRAGESVLYDGPVRALCPLAPNNVNTIACAAIATESARCLGFDGVVGRLVSDPSLTAHVIEIEVTGAQGQAENDCFNVSTRRYNPAKSGAVTGNATYSSFWSSLLMASRNGGRRGLQLC